MLLSRPSSVSSVSHESGVSREEEEEEEEEEGSFEAKAMEGEDDSSGDIGIVTETGHRPRQMGILPALCISQMSKETYYSVKRDLLHCQKRPRQMGILPALCISQRSAVPNPFPGSWRVGEEATCDLDRFWRGIHAV